MKRILFIISLLFFISGQSSALKTIRMYPTDRSTNSHQHDKKKIAIYGDELKGLAKKTMAARYHSLVAAPDSLPACLKVISRDERGEIMAVRHKTMPIYGVQFHPESILTPQGTTIMQNFLKMEN